MEERVTESAIEIKVIDTTAKEDSEASFPLTEFCRKTMFQTDNPSRCWATCEWNGFPLDGSMNLSDEQGQWLTYPYVSTLTDGRGQFANTHAINIEFSKPHTSNGITFLFDGMVPDSILIYWYGENGTQINWKTFYPDSQHYPCENNVRDFKKLQIIFTSTTPYARVKLANIEYGINILADGDMLREGTITEEVDPVSAEISINTLGFTIYDRMEEFNPLDFKGKYFGLQEGQKVYVTETVDGKPMKMGTYYIQTWESNNEHEITFQCIDLIGQINKTVFKKSRMYMDERAGTVIDEIMASAGVTDYLIEEELKNVLINGYIAVCTHRDAIQQVAFAIRAVVECDRNGRIRFYRIENVASGKISSERLFMDGGKIKVKDLICGIDVMTHAYTVSQEQEKVFEGILPKGKSEILFGSPVTGITLDYGEIVESGINYAVVSMAAEGNVTVSGYKYQDNTAIYHISSGDGEENTAKVQDATLISKYNVHLLAEHLLKYYALRKEAEQEYIMETEKTGRWTNLRLQNNNIVSGCIEKQVIDLTGGFLSTATVVGYNTVVSDFPFTGTEIHTGEEIGVV